MTQEIGDALCESFGIERLIDFRVDEVDQFKNNYFFVAKAALHEKGLGFGQDRSFVYGFTRDATDRIWWIILPILILFGLSIFVRNFFLGQYTGPHWPTRIRRRLCDHLHRDSFPFYIATWC